MPAALRGVAVRGAPPRRRACAGVPGAGRTAAKRTRAAVPTPQQAPARMGRRASRAPVAECASGQRRGEGRGGLAGAEEQGRRRGGASGSSWELVGQGGGLVGAPIDRRRADAGEGGDVTPKAPVPARACTGRRVDRARTVPRACAADLPRRAGPTDPIPRSTCRPSPPLSARRWAEAPGELPARFGRPGELLVHTAARTGVGYGSKPSRAPERRPRMPERRLESALEHQLFGVLQAPPEGVSGQLPGVANPRSNGTGLGPRVPLGVPTSLRAAITIQEAAP